AQLETMQERAQPADLRQARLFLESLDRTSKALHDPEAGTAIRDVVSYPGTSVADVLGFMQRHNLRFAPAANPQEKEALGEFRALLAEYRQKLVATLESR